MLLFLVRIRSIPIFGIQHTDNELGTHEQADLSEAKDFLTWWRSLIVALNSSYGAVGAIERAGSIAPFLTP